MRKRTETLRKLTFASALLAFGAAQCWAGSVLVFEDADLGTSAVTGAITLAGDTETVAPDQGTFNTLLAEGGWSAVIFGEQGGEIYADSSSQLAAWVAGGGVLIGDTWQDGGLDTLLDGAVASTNGSTITTDGSPVFAGLGGTISLSSPGWGIFSQGYSALTGGTCLGSLDSGGCAVIQGNGGLTFLNAPLNDTYGTLSDGQQLIANELDFAGSSAPEPGSFLLMGGGLLGLAGFARRRFSK